MGLIGGSFNPPHKGHFKVAKLALVSLNLDEVWWLVSPRNPFKSLNNMLPLSKRLELTKEKALHPKFKVLKIESLFNTTNTYSLLNKFIEKERLSGSVLINDHLLVRHKRWSLPLSSFVLTIIAVSVSSFKRRGGMGINLAFGITLGFIYIFFDKVFGILVNKSTFSPDLALSLIHI